MTFDELMVLVRAEDVAGRDMRRILFEQEALASEMGRGRRMLAGLFVRIGLALDRSVIDRALPTNASRHEAADGATRLSFR